MKTQERGLRIEDSGAEIEDLDSASECADAPVLLNPQSHILNPDVLQRVRWRCRRGLLELDIVFERFVKLHYASLSASERQTFEEFLDMADNPLWDLISGKSAATTDTQRTLLLKINSL